MPTHPFDWVKRVAPTHRIQAVVFLDAVAEAVAAQGDDTNEVMVRMRDLAIGAIGVLVAVDKVGAFVEHAWKVRTAKRRFFTRKAAFTEGMEAAFTFVENVLASRACGCPECAANIMAAEFTAEELARQHANQPTHHDKSGE